MADCENIQGCPIFNQFKSESTANYWILTFCKGRHERCKRKELKSQGQSVPPEMLPNGKNI